MTIKLKLSGHETFYPRDQWLIKGLKSLEYDQNSTKDDIDNDDLLTDEVIKLERDFPTDYYGVGINMVNSIRFWLTAFQLTEGSSNQKQATSLANSLMSLDPYLSKLQTLRVLHYYLVTGGEYVTTWYWFFCCSRLMSFNKIIFFRNYKDWLKENFPNNAYSDRSIENDYKTLCGMYSVEQDNPKTDLFYPSQFSKLGLLKHNRFQQRYVRVSNPI